MEDTNVVEETNAAGETAAPVEETAAETPEVEAAEVFSPDDSLLERAVKAGMSLTDAKALPSKEFADRILGALEKNASVAAGGGGSAGGGDEGPAIDFSGFSEDDGYDPTLVKVLGSLKSVIENQAKVIKQLKAGGSAKSTKAVEVRKNLTLARPGGESGRKNATPATAEADILSALRNKFKLN